MFAQANRAPLILRVNQKQYSREQYQALLSDVGIESAPIDSVAGVSLPSVLLISNPVPVSELPGFYGGATSVQDAVAQIAATLLNPQPGNSILDAYAAPGGKTAHLLEMADCQMLALELDGERIGKISGNLDRLRLNSDKVEVFRGDASNGAWWDGEPFDKIFWMRPAQLRELFPGIRIFHFCVVRLM